MPKKVRPIPKGYHSVTPYLCVRGGGDAIRVLQEGIWCEGGDAHARAWGRERSCRADDRRFKIMLADEFPQMGFQSPKGLWGHGQ